MMLGGARPQPTSARFATRLGSTCRSTRSTSATGRRVAWRPGQFHPHALDGRRPYRPTLSLHAGADTGGFGLRAGAGAAGGDPAAVRRGRWLDQALSVVSLFGLSVPGIALGPVLISGVLDCFGMAAGLGGERWVAATPSTGGTSFCIRDDGGIACGHSHAHGAHGDAGRTGAGLYSHRARQGAERDGRLCANTLCPMRWCRL